MAPQYWSNAATLMVAARFLGKSTSRVQTIMSTKSERTLHFDYKVMMLKRSSKSSFMKSAFVFPGGRTSKIDSDYKMWEPLFCQHFGTNSAKLKTLFNNLVPKYMPYMYAFPTGNEALKNSENAHLVFNEQYKSLDEINVGSTLKSMWGIIQHRLSAIRETFEEVGILMYTDKDAYSSNIEDAVIRRPKHVENHDMKEWQSSVNEDSDRFFTMFKELGK